MSLTFFPRGVSRTYRPSDAARAWPIRRPSPRTLPRPQHRRRSGLRDADEVARGVAEHLPGPPKRGKWGLVSACPSPRHAPTPVRGLTGSVEVAGRAAVCRRGPAQRAALPKTSRWGKNQVNRRRPSALSPRMRALGTSRQLSGTAIPHAVADRINPPVCDLPALPDKQNLARN